MSAIETTTATGPAVRITRPDTSGFSAQEWDLLAGCWHPVALSEELAGGGSVLDEPRQPEAPPPGAFRSVLLDVGLVAFRGANGDATVLLDRCPHRGARLSDGVVADGCVTCPYHGFTFDGGGRCISVPSSATNAVPPRMHLEPLPVIERYSIVWTCLRPDLSAAVDGPADDAPGGRGAAGDHTDDGGPLPPWSRLEEAGFQRAGCRPFVWHASAQRHAENFNDQAHFPYIHAGTFGVEDPVVPPLDVEVDGRLLSLDVTMIQQARQTFDGSTADTVVAYRYRWHLPFSSWLEIDYPHGGTELIGDVAAPVHADACRVYLANARNFDTDQPVEDWVAFQDAVNAEDRWIVEQLEPRGVPIDMGVEVHVKADAMSIAARRWFRSHLAPTERP
jgi:vanillate O-demethylase monooxygenase subunit